MDKLSELAKRLRPYIKQTKFVPLITPLTSTSFDSDSFSDVSTSTQIDLSATFGTPEGIKAVLLKVKALDSATWNGRIIFRMWAV